jgi:RNA polymerase sigma factor (TIGR02999 family)
MRRERLDHTLQPTALVHEAYLKLIKQREVNWQNRAHFFGVSAQLMRRILVDYARGHLRAKRGGSQQRISLDQALQFSQEQSRELVAIDEALRKLERVDHLQSQIVTLRFFVGLTEEQIAEVLKISPKTVQREWNFAKAWLHGELAKS